MPKISIYVPDKLWRQVPRDVTASRFVQNALSYYLHRPGTHDDHCVQTYEGATYCFTCKTELKELDEHG